MAIVRTCTCGNPLRTSSEHLGRSLQCPACGAHLTFAPGSEARAGEGGATGKDGLSRSDVPRASRGRQSWFAVTATIALFFPLGVAAFWWQPRQSVVAEVYPADTDKDPVLIHRNHNIELKPPNLRLLQLRQPAPEEPPVPSGAGGFISLRVGDLWTDGNLESVARHLPIDARNFLADKQDRLGLRPGDVERVSYFTLLDQGGLWGHALARKPIDPTRLRDLLGLGLALPHPNKKHFYPVLGFLDLRVDLPEDRSLDFGDAVGVLNYLDLPLGAPLEAALAEASSRPGRTPHLVAGLLLTPLWRERVRKQWPKDLESYIPLYAADKVFVFGYLGDEVQVHADLYFADEGKAGLGKQALEAAWEDLRQRLLRFKEEVTSGLGRPEAGEKIFAPLEAALAGARVTSRGKEVALDLHAGRGSLTAALESYLRSAHLVREAAWRRDSAANLRGLASAMLAYAKDHQGALPATVIRDAEGKPLYSWRVELLPYLGRRDLYEQYHKDEPWDSPFNRTLLHEMPAAFLPPGPVAREGDLTPYQLFVGPSTPFGGPGPARLPETLVRGPAQTVLIAEAARLVPWTKPADLGYAPDRPLPPLGYLPGPTVNVALADGSVVAVSRAVPERAWREAISATSREPLGPEWPGGPR